ncbi:unnamed protein product [Symbiodinium pilosum]|uniref:Apple domain-containing protein n=1 Tax=Symbiodinium pilosum TaxID=2952 RepID=A0A812Q0G4_SYMPI|nr:unnamed protein product [Symbiodinium pilosum]
MKSFDFTSLTNKCQCFPGCAETFLGNTCCPDYKSHCEAGAAPEAQTTATAVTIAGYTTYANAHCSDVKGASELTSTNASPDACAKQCQSNAECEGFTVSSQNSCTLLAGINIPACAASPGKFSTYVKLGPFSNLLLRFSRNYLEATLLFLVGCKSSSGRKKV